MTTTIAKLLKQIKQCSKEEQKLILGTMLEELSTPIPDSPYHQLLFGRGSAAFYLPHFVSTKTEPPKLSPEGEAESMRRYQDRDNYITREEMMELLENTQNYVR